ncbi:hypothetical protein PPL_09276 [Heterostelium album PN500]|uniref:Uncharacterized protein n=1 Tax=Heterostelium pallidum (strain ATCC 26659 / Pp 5 / PN500) TaxID=670386 RepID=D3BL44_HETP5|nr:hypothetical protein PPL_09276 [Heterostelium album PN500]EFA77778.1 hypothetical protein PPL_09276 [Heterostelium album PN500]|eukprot:XP_020429906.1 hypothetical protein PPL_09276 [Heterostelium album PN500]
MDIKNIGGSSSGEQQENISNNSNNNNSNNNSSEYREVTSQDGSVRLTSRVDDVMMDLLGDDMPKRKSPMSSQEEFSGGSQGEHKSFLSRKKQKPAATPPLPSKPAAKKKSSKISLDQLLQEKSQVRKEVDPKFAFEELMSQQTAKKQSIEKDVDLHSIEIEKLKKQPNLKDEYTQLLKKESYATLKIYIQNGLDCIVENFGVEKLPKYLIDILLSYVYFEKDELTVYKSYMILIQIISKLKETKINNYNGNNNNNSIPVTTTTTTTTTADSTATTPTTTNDSEANVITNGNGNANGEVHTATTSTATADNSNSNGNGNGNNISNSNNSNNSLLLTFNDFINLFELYKIQTNQTYKAPSIILSNETPSPMSLQSSSPFPFINLYYVLNLLKVLANENVFTFEETKHWILFVILLMMDPNYIRTKDGNDDQSNNKLKSTIFKTVLLLGPLLQTLLQSFFSHLANESQETVHKQVYTLFNDIWSSIDESVRLTLCTKVSYLLPPTPLNGIDLQRTFALFSISNILKMNNIETIIIQPSIVEELVKILKPFIAQIKDETIDILMMLNMVALTDICCNDRKELNQQKKNDKKFPFEKLIRTWASKIKEPKDFDFNKTRIKDGLILIQSKLASLILDQSSSSIMDFFKPVVKAENDVQQPIDSIVDGNEQQQQQQNNQNN